MLKGTAITIEIAVTESVPAIKLARPNCPRVGCQVAEKSKSFKLLIANIGLALTYKPNIMRRVKLKTARHEMKDTRRATMSLNFLAVTF